MTFINGHQASGAAMEGTFELSPEVYGDLFRSGFYTIVVTTDHNPWHRKTGNWRQRNWKLLHGLIWTFRKHILRRDLIETTSVTIHDCRLIPVELERQ